MHVGRGFTSFLLCGIIIMGRVLSFYIYNRGRSTSLCCLLSAGLMIWYNCRSIIIKKMKLVRFRFSPLIYRGENTLIWFLIWNQIVFVFYIILLRVENRSFWNWPVLLFPQIRSFWNWDVFKLTHFKLIFARFRSAPIIYIRIIKKLHITRIWS